MTLSSSSKTIGDTLARIDREVVFADKRVIPPVRPKGPRIAGTLHLSGKPRKTMIA